MPHQVYDDCGSQHTQDDECRAYNKSRSDYLPRFVSVQVESVRLGEQLLPFSHELQRFRAVAVDARQLGPEVQFRFTHLQLALAWGFWGPSDNDRAHVV